MADSNSNPWPPDPEASRPEVPRPLVPPASYPRAANPPAKNLAGGVSLSLAIVGWAVVLIALTVYNPPFLGRTVVNGKTLPDTTHFMIKPLIFATFVMILAIITGIIGRKSVAGWLGIAGGLAFFGLALMAFMSAC